MVSPLKVGIGQFSYHRYFGDLARWEDDPGIRWNLTDFIDRAKFHRVAIVGLQTCYLTPEEREHLHEISATHGLEVILEWGHPAGLEMGKSPAAVQDLRSWILRAGQCSFPLLRIVAGYPTFRGQEPVEVQTSRLIPILQELCSEAMDLGITLAIENHADFTLIELQRLIHSTDRPNLRAVIDVGNSVRLGEDMLLSVRTLAPLACAVHLRDLVILPQSIGNPLASWPTAPLGRGCLDIAGTLQELYSSGFSGCMLLELSHLHANWAGKEDEVIGQSLLWLKEWEESGDPSVPVSETAVGKIPPMLARCHRTPQ